MSVICKEAYYNSSTGKDTIRALIWHDDTVAPIGVFQIAHGVCEHIGRYDDFARFLASNGFVVCGNDHLGHGKSVKSLADLGHTADENGDVRMVDDMHILTCIMKKRYPNLPYFLFGHSMGSFAARIYAADFGHELDGVIFCGTGQIPGVAALLKDAVEKTIDKIGVRKSSLGTMQLLGKLWSIPYKNDNDPLAWLSVDLENRERYREDPLCNFNLKLSGLRDLLKLQLGACAPDWTIRMPLYLPVLLISGEKDPVGSNGKGVIALADALEMAGIEPTVILYPNMRHEILNETEKEKVYFDIKNWLMQVLNGEFKIK
ncbi:MAG: alpha/beta hydrolase [Clostridiales bacterium]|jgi:alpha-beta hydrolase superfamily lysophospholipase|nr:alpha/beta hydrolase [Clostridiales bacterium]HOA33337.1 alpha/beta fold hydrolase [Clostridiales bacterium]HOL78449.1 alpha/beta fold hydrolase [Clostridiales bacterium]HPP68060.1 alpha/beta fold hydrolase [Clostridiales bacterium]HPU67659.1 alpha/beta fold hydrolase [Clostridiales bacterium]